jgi:hypothetical protein
LKAWISYDSLGPSKHMLYLPMKWDLVISLCCSLSRIFVFPTFILNLEFLAEVSPWRLGFVIFRKNHTNYCFLSISFQRECFSTSCGCSTFYTTKLGARICNRGAWYECCMYYTWFRRFIFIYVFMLLMYVNFRRLCMLDLPKLVALLENMNFTFRRKTRKTKASNLMSFWHRMRW